MLLLALAACRIDSADFRRVDSVKGAELPGPTPPPAEGPGGERLYQLLYAAEYGEQARPAGQRARMHAWLDVVDFTDAQLEAFAALGEKARALAAEDRTAVAAYGEREAAALVPLYEELTRRLLEPGSLTDAELEGFAARLEAARKIDELDPRAEHVRRVRQMLKACAGFVAGLSYEQRTRVTQSRFFLARRLDPLGNPGDYATWVGMLWDGGDFSSLRSTARSEDEGQMDLGGLWATESIRSSPGEYLTMQQAQAIVLVAVLEPGLMEAVAERGQQARDD